MIIITHNGKFHSDEVVAFAMLRYLFPECEIIRTRDMEFINNKHKDDIVIDVGMIYNSYQNRYDHHQENFKHTFTKKDKILLSSAGLIYRHFGKQLLKKFAEENDKEYINSVYYKFYFSFLIGIDAWDNGVEPIPRTTKRAYRSDISLMQTISACNCIETWDDKKQMDKFILAADLAWTIISIHLNRIFESMMELNDEAEIMKSGFDNRFEITNTSEIILIEKKCINWYKLLNKYERIYSLEGVVKFIIYPKNDGTWKVKTPKSDFENRQDIKKIESDELIFIHKNRFVANLKTKEAAIQLAVESLN